MRKAKDLTAFGAKEECYCAKKEQAAIFTAVLSILCGKTELIELLAFHYLFIIFCLVGYTGSLFP